MRIGILTAPLASNIGGILQNYALQQVLEEMGHNPMTIDLGKKYTRFQWLLGRVHGLLICKYNRVPFPYYNRIGSYRILKFAMNNIKRSEFMTRIEPEVISSYNFEACIVGSDQVWRKEYNANLYWMYLDFVQSSDVKKIAYAASIGVEEWDYNEAETLRCRELIADFNAVSVRESSDVALCKRYLAVDAVHVLDPTLLLGKEKYKKLCESIRHRDKKILFAYILDLTNEKRILAKEMAEELGCQLIIKSAENNTKEGDTIEEWISYYRDSHFVVTDSYHGTLFSIIFNKSFVSLPNEKRGNSRFLSILGKLGLMERLWNGNLELVKKSIDWDSVNQRLDLEQTISLAFLKNALTDKL